MKKIILSLALLFAFVVADAQITPMTSASYTVTNSGTSSLTAQIKGAWNVVAVEHVMTKVSGTVAGTSVLYGSVNGVAYSPVPVAVIKGGVNSYTNLDQTSNSYVWLVEPSGYQYYRILTTGTGTMVGTVTGAVMTR